MGPGVLAGSADFRLVPGPRSGFKASSPAPFQLVCAVKYAEAFHNAVET